MLVSKNAAVPVGVDLSGFWQLRTSRGDKRLASIGRDELLIPVSRSKHHSRRRNSDGASAQVFLESGESLKITQTFYGIFISYDRSVVEEYTFGENRLVTIGPIEAKRVSGWEDGAFVVETLDESRATLFETWRLQSPGVLVRDIRISRGEQDLLVQQQVFDRK